jgi:hypothetical protein
MTVDSEGCWASGVTCHSTLSARPPVVLGVSHLGRSRLQLHLGRVAALVETAIPDTGELVSGIAERTDSGSSR